MCKNSHHVVAKLLYVFEWIYKHHILNVAEREVYIRCQHWCSVCLYTSWQLCVIIELTDVLNTENLSIQHWNFIIVICIIDISIITASVLLKNAHGNGGILRNDTMIFLTFSASRLTI
jgi:hypothetical protein